MKIERVIWLEEIVEKLSIKHHVTPEEVEYVLETSKHFRFIEKGKVKNEHVYAAFGRTTSGRRLTLFFIYKRARKGALILSARDSAAKELTYHEK